MTLYTDQACTQPLDVEIVEGWGKHHKYNLKANFMDHTHARNICSCKLWGRIVKSRANVPTELSVLPNGGAIDGFPVIITGDFNAELSHAMFEPFDGWVYDARSTAPVTDSRATYHGFGRYSTKIDHIFYTGLEPLEYRTINKTYEGVTYISDHYPVMALFELTGSANPDDPQAPGNYGDLTEEDMPLDDYNEPPQSGAGYDDMTEESYPLE